MSGVSAIEFSIVVPTFDRPEALAGCLESLARLRYPKERFEVIVVDDGGTADLERVVSVFRGRLHLHLSRQENCGPAAARNTGARHARGDCLVFSDDDCRPAEDWLEVLARIRATDAGAAICGGRKNAFPENLPAVASQAITDAVCEYFNADTRHPGFVTTSNLSTPAEEFLALGGFDESFRTAEDREFGDRWRATGLPMIYAPDAIVYHCQRLTVGGLWNRHFRMGRGARQFFRKRLNQGRGGLRPDFGFYRRLLRYPFATHKPGRAAVLLGLIILAQTANSIGYWREAMRDSSR